MTGADSPRQHSRRELLAQLSLLAGLAVSSPKAYAEDAAPQQLDADVKAAVLKAFNKVAGKNKVCGS